MSDDLSDPYLWPGHPKYGAQHYEMLGRFIARFAQTEIIFHMAFRWYSQMPIAEARLFFGKSHTRELIEHTRRLMRLHKVDKDLIADFDTLAKQFKIIAEKRDAIIHREFRFLKSEYIIYDIPFVKDVEKASVIRLSIEDFQKMNIDLRSMDLRIRYHHIKSVADIDTTFAWQYEG